MYLRTKCNQCFGMERRSSNNLAGEKSTRSRRSEAIWLVSREEKKPDRRLGFVMSGRRCARSELEMARWELQVSQPV